MMPAAATRTRPVAHVLLLCCCALAAAFGDGSFSSSSVGIAHGTNVVHKGKRTAASLRREKYEKEHQLSPEKLRELEIEHKEEMKSCAGIFVFSMVLIFLIVMLGMIIWWAAFL